MFHIYNKRNDFMYSCDDASRLAEWLSNHSAKLVAVRTRISGTKIGKWKAQSDDVLVGWVVKSQITGGYDD